MAGKVLIIDDCSPLKLHPPAGGQESATQSATTHTIYRYLNIGLK